MKVKTGRLSEAVGNSKKKVAIGSICCDGNAIFRDHTNHRSHWSKVSVILVFLRRSIENCCFWAVYLQWALDVESLPSPFTVIRLRNFKKVFTGLSDNYAYFFSVEHVVKYSAVNVQNREFAYLSLVTWILKEYARTAFIKTTSDKLTKRLVGILSSLLFSFFVHEYEGYPHRELRFD